MTQLDRAALRRDAETVVRTCYFAYTAVCRPRTVLALLDELETVERERDEVRETNRRLNRRCQLAERAATEKLTASTGSLGRGLANYGAHLYMRERDAARAEAEQMREERDKLLRLTDVKLRETYKAAAEGADRYFQGKHTAIFELRNLFRRSSALAALEGSGRAEGSEG